MTHVLMKRGHRHTGQSCVEIRPETGVLWSPPRNECLSHQKLGEGRFSASASGGSMARPTPCFWISCLQNHETGNFCCKPQFATVPYSSLGKLIDILLCILSSSELPVGHYHLTSAKRLGWSYMTLDFVNYDTEYREIPSEA